jgi:hypothetical protein
MWLYVSSFLLCVCVYMCVCVCGCLSGLDYVMDWFASITKPRRSKLLIVRTIQNTLHDKIHSSFHTDAFFVHTAYQPTSRALLYISYDSWTFQIISRASSVPSSPWLCFSNRRLSNYMLLRYPEATKPYWHQLASWPYSTSVNILTEGYRISQTSCFALACSHSFLSFASAVFQNVQL